MKLYFILFFLCASCTGYAQTGKIITDSINSESIAHTITKENPVRQLAVYIPPAYHALPKKRFPVLYLLHGVGDSQEAFTADTTAYSNIKDLMDRGIAAGKFGEMIVVMPNEKTNWFGSFYTNSTATGNWEDFTVTELTAYIDKQYRTLPFAASRAIAGHSMGGYGALALAMKHPEVFSTVYGMNAALFCFCGELKPENPDVQTFVKAQTMEEVWSVQNYTAAGLLNLARAVSPNPSNPPLYLDKPFILKDRALIPDRVIYKKWEEKNAVQMAVTYKNNLLKLKAIKFDSGNKDDSQFIIENNRRLAEKLKSLEVPHQFEEYDGDHNNKLWGPAGRIYNHLLPFIYQHLQK